MDQAARAGRPPISAPGDGGQRERSPEEIREELERTRRDLGDTVEALAEKADVRAQARQRVQGVRDTVAQRRTELTAKARETAPGGAQEGGRRLAARVREHPAPVALAGAVLAGFLVGRASSRR